jgi:hypothetical protein
MVKSFDKSLSDLRDASVQVSEGISYPEPGMASVDLLFSNGSRLRAEYWRVIKNGKAGISSFDHRQKYGLPEPIDAVKELREQLQDQTVAGARLNKETGDLHFKFAGNIELQVFNFTSYEIWEFSFPGGTVEFSNYVE